MPALGVAVVAAGAGTAVATSFALTGLSAALVTAGVATVVSGVLNRDLAKTTPIASFEAESRERQVVVRSAVAPRRIVYGQAPVSGPLVYIESTGGLNQYLHFVVPLAGHEVDAIGDIYFEDELVPLDANGFGRGRFAKSSVITLIQSMNGSLQVTVPGDAITAVESVRIDGLGGNTADVSPNAPEANWQYSRSGNVFTFSTDWNAGRAVEIRYSVDGTSASYVRVKKHLGTTSQAADTDLVAESAGIWTANHRLRGIAYIYVRLEWNQDIFPNGLPNVRAMVRGKKVYDPRNGATAWSDNWALCVRDYIASSYGLDAGGVGSPASTELDDVSVTAAANISDEHLAIEAGSPAPTQTRYTVNGTVNLEDKPSDILRQLCSAAAGAVVFSQGVWRVFAGAYATPTVDIDLDWLRGRPRLTRTKPPRRELYNGVRGTFSDEANSYQGTDFPPVTNSTYETQDGGQQILRAIELPFTTNSIRAQRIAKIHLEKSRQGIVVELPCNLKAFRVAVWDTVRLTIAALGWSNKVFQVVEWRFIESGGVDLVLQEEASSVYDWSLGNATIVDPAPDTDLQSPFAGLDVVVGTPVSEGQLYIAGDGTIVTRIKVPFAGSTNPFVRYYEAQFARSINSPTEWQDAPDVTAPAAEAFMYPVEDGAIYDGRVRAVTSLGNAGEWSYFYGHMVSGKTTPPSDVEGFSAQQEGGVIVFDCATVEDDDLDTVEIRLADLGNLNWDDASPITNILRGKTTTSKAVPPGMWTFLAKAKDTSGNYSDNVASVDLEVTSAGYTTIEEADQAPGWLGAKVNMVQHWTGVLVPESQSLASALGWEVFDEFVPNAYTDCYYTAPVIDKGMGGTARIRTDIVSVLGPGETTGLADPDAEIDYRTPAGSFDGFEVWTSGTADFRYVQGRMHVDTTVGKPVISQFTVTVDGAQRTQTGELVVGAGGSGSVTFTDPFNAPPVVTVSPQGSGDVSASHNGVSETGFTGFFKTAGVAGAGTISWTATGV